MSLTFITPVSPDHAPYLTECQASVAAQAIRCAHIWAYDLGRDGPAVMRNRLLAEVKTEYVSFLDADDWIEPDYAERMLDVARAGWYVYCDHFQDDRHIKTPATPWCVGAFHVVTAVVPTALAQFVGGFDETLPALEDTDFFIKLLSKNICGIHVPYPLMHYRKGGGRGLAAHTSGEELVIKQELHRRYGAIKMGCCGDMTIQQGPIGVKQEGDVLAQALWGGNRAEHGRATGRAYPRVSFPKTTWVSPRDIAAAPHMWREVRDPEPADPLDALAVGEGANAIIEEMATRGVYSAPPPVFEPPVEVHPTPDIAKVKRLGRPRKAKND